MALSDIYRRVAAARTGAAIVRITSAPARRDRLVVTGPFKAPITDIEECLASLWSDVMGLDVVGVDDNFFELGGESLQFAHILARIATDLGVTLAAEVFLEGPTIRELSAWLAHRPGLRLGQCAR